MKYCTVCKTKYEDNVSFCPLDGEVLEDDPSSLVNKTLDGQYHIESLLGKGGMGAVFRARHILLGDRVAIKVLPPQMRNNAEWLRRFRREGQAARRFRHPNAVTVYDLRTTSEGLIYMVMEYVEGHTLDAELKTRGRFTPLDALEVLEPVMSVLNAAHAMGVVHRDLKPDNIMIGKAGTGGRPVIKLLDLGIAKISELAGSEGGGGGTTALTVAGQILGTPYYMSPEQWGEVPSDGNMEIDGRADIYSLGTVFYELLSGKRPYCGLSLQELRREHVSVTPKPLHEVQPDVPEAFGRAVARAMAKDRGERQATAAQLDAELRAALGLPQIDISGTAFASTGSSLQNTGSSTQGTGPAAGGGATAQFTQDIPDGRSTQVEVNAPTMLSLDQPPGTGTTPLPGSTQQQTPGASAQPLLPTSLGPSPVNQGQSIAPAQSMSASQQTSAPPAYMPGPQVAPYAPASPARRSSVPFIIAGVLVLLLIVGAVGGLLVWKGMGGKADEANNNGEGNKGGVSSNTSPGSETAAAEKEELGYWLEIDSPAGDGETTRAAGVLPLASGQSFKFHFEPRQDGYFYIIGPAEGNVPTSFLTSVPVAMSGLETNEAKSGADFSFPSGDDNWMTLDKTPGTEIYTIIFSPTPLSAPAFLNAEAGQPLSEAEQQELKELRSSATIGKTGIENDKGSNPYVSIKVPQAKADSGPVIFDVRIEHK
ncbi:MAG TPA: protein kinase [Pyrinomonadaceae bacterium]|jgi:serine/threonine-protein kinase